MDGLEDDTRFMLLLGGGDDSLDHENANLNWRNQMRTIKEKFLNLLM